MLKKIKAINFFQAIAFLALVYLVFLINAKAPDLATADLGRHIMNGRIICKAFIDHNQELLNAVLNTNLYSYTEADHTFTNHHWLSGVIFYLLSEYSNLSVLSFLNVCLILAANLLFFRSAQILSGTNLALLLTVLSLPITCMRSEVRPESLSYFLLALVFYLFVLYDKDKLSFKKLLASFTLIQVLWINLHIFFFTGFMVAFCFGVKYLIQKNNARVKHLLTLALVALVFSCLNPHGLSGLLYPLNIFHGYGYQTAENQSVFFMQFRAPLVVNYYYYEIFVLVFLITAYFSRKRIDPALFALVLIFLVLGMKTNRAMSLGAFFLVPFMADALKISLEKHSKNLLIAACIVLGAFISVYGIWAKQGFMDFKFNNEVNKAAYFFQANDIKGPIFNNFDIGGYLIYHLFPFRRVFVDNRPEAYSEELLQNVYLKALEDESFWQQLDKQVNFNVIFFYRHDMTEFGQPFLIRRIEDPSWVPVSVDAWNIILLKDNEVNRPLINVFRLPQAMFKAVPT